LEELRRQTEKEILAKTPPEKRLEGLSAEDLLKALTPLEELRRETEKEILAKTPAEKRLEGLSVDDLLKALTPEVRAALLKRLKEEEASRKPQDRAGSKMHTRR
jgi:hypothetical protein